MTKLSACVLAAGLTLAGGASAEVLSSRHALGGCLDINMSNKRAVIWNCHGGFNQNFVSGYGQMRVQGQCLDTVNGSNQGGTRQGDELIIRGCTNSRSQKWGFDQASGAFRNEEGWCADIKDGSKNAGAGVVAWKCHGGTNQRWFTGNVIRLDQAASRGANKQNLDALRAADAKINGAGGSLVAAGGGNLVAAGGGNLVAAGGGNLVAAGGGN